MTKRRWALLAVTMLSILAADQITKALVRGAFGVGESRSLISGVLWLTHVENTGAAFGMFRGYQWLLVLVAVAVLASIAYVGARVRPEGLLARTALAMIAAGACGNLIDRVVAGCVTDFIDLGWWPVFNVADIALDVGVALLVWWLLFGAEHRRHPAPIAADGEGTDAAATCDE